MPRNVDRVLRFDLEQYSLSNGLRVVLHPDRSLPMAVVNLWYHVGSRDDFAGCTGLAHLFEHLMFEGSLHHDDEYFTPLQEAGGSVNGSTNKDRTNYYEVVPSHFLELALWMEADRMGHLLSVLTPEKLENQRSVVKNERRQRIDNQPYGRVAEEMSQLIYPESDPYRWPVIGWMEDLDRIDLDSAFRFSQTFYTPSNATLVVAGDFDRDKTVAQIERWFGPIPAGPTPKRWEPAARQAPVFEPRRLRIEDAVALPRLDIVWPTMARFHPDEPALDYAAQILAGRSKDSRLKRKLLHEQTLVNSVGGFHATMHRTGQFGVRAFCLEKTSPAEVEQIVRDAIDELKKTPPTEQEVERARNLFRNQAYARIETILSKADAFNHDLFFAKVLSPESFAEELAQYESVTAADIQRVVNDYLIGEPVVGETIPEKVSKSNRAKGTETTTGGEKHKGGVVGPLPLPDEQRPFQLPPIETATTAQGLRILFVPWRKLPRVDYLFLFPGGSSYDPVEKMGLARLTADVMDEGTLTRDGLQMASDLDMLGAQLSVTTGLESMTVGLRTLGLHRDAAFALLAETMLTPRFAEQDLARERARLLSEIAYHEKDPSSIADEAIDAALYGPEHPYGRTPDGTPETVGRITPADLAAFHAQVVLPEGAALLVVGDTSLPDVLTLVDRHLKDWGTGSATTRSERPELPEPVEGSPLDFHPREGAAQSVLRLATRLMPRNSPDYIPMMLWNTILGGQFTSRLNRILREEKGFTYGVRSSLSCWQRGGMMLASTDVQSSATAEAAGDILRECFGPLNGKPVLESELDYAKAYLSRRFPARFETAGSIASHLAQIVLYDLPLDYYDHFLDLLDSVTVDQIHDVLGRYMARERFKVVIVGDPTCEASLAGALSVSPST